jgi:hypothetical protein
MDTPMGNSGFGSNTGFDTGATPTSTGGTGSMASTSSGVCPTCGQSKNAAGSNGLEQFLGKLGISDDMVNNLKTSMQNVDIEEYLNTARDFLKGGSDKATNYAKENPGKVAAGVAVLAVGAGLLISAMNRD